MECTMQIKCNECDFWGGHNFTKIGSCKRHSPIILPVCENEDGHWPQTDKAAWCGDAERITPENLEARRAAEEAYKNNPFYALDPSTKLTK